MGKKAREKRERREAAGSKKTPTKLKLDAKAAGDLRLIPAHIEHYLRGVPEAARALRDLGRDAAELVIEIARAKQHAELEAFGKKLVALKPQLETNMIELRAEAIDDVLERAEKSAVAVGVGTSLSFEGMMLGFFDPLSVADALVKGGRPRADRTRVARGDIAWFPLGGARTIRVSEGSTPPPGALELRLKVSSGLVYVGPPEASDGPRLGSVRLHPHRTQLDDFESKGRFLKVPEGMYAVHVELPPEGEIRVHLNLTPDAEPIEVDLASLGLPDPPPT
jgi:hypothetical protein